MARYIRAFIEHSPKKEGDEVFLAKEEGNHLSRVLRLQAGDGVELLDGKGGRYASKCLEVSRAQVRVGVEKIEKFSAGIPQTRMAIALGKGNKWEELIRPLTELGINRLTPLCTERTEGVFSFAKLKDKKERWTRIAREACKQSGNPWLPIFDDPVNFEDLLKAPEVGEKRWIASLTKGTARQRLDRDTRLLSLFIGPEGGWSQKEEVQAKNAGLSSFSLGPHVLRVETAAVSALAVARQLLLC
ncbi:16S rRNA (uracil(1498)-N(3))-methyltransferase [Opitutales bacterium]|nr:16S rRNA (uracil(1498)-N(3))-methyltransferase [Opitutales bacterium]